MVGNPTLKIILIFNEIFLNFSRIYILSWIEIRTILILNSQMKNMKLNYFNF